MRGATTRQPKRRSAQWAAGGIDRAASAGALPLLLLCFALAATGCADGDSVDGDRAAIDDGIRLDVTDTDRGGSTHDMDAPVTDADGIDHSGFDAFGGDATAPMPDASTDALPDALHDAMADVAPDDMADAITDIAPDASVDLGPDPAPPEGPATYPAGRTQSPLTPAVAAHLRAIADRAPRQPDVFSKIGASSTVSTAFLHCFAGDAIHLDGRDALRPTIDHFLTGDADGTDPYTRQSLSATVGWSARNALAGDPSPLQQEIDATDPRFAIVMYGTNDIQRRDIDGYASDLFTLVDTLTAQGIIPLLSSVMPRDDDADADLLVPSYNAVVRGVAQARQVPFIDYHRELITLPDHGLGPDRLHASVYRVDGIMHPCDFRPDGLRYGYNIRNFITLEALTRVLAALTGHPAPDPPTALIEATGSIDDPINIPALPYTDTRDTRDSPHRHFAAYPACDAGQNESGPEVVYRLRLDRPTIIRAWVLDRGTVDVDLHLLGGRDAASCLDRDHREINASLDPGEWHLVVDTFVAAAGERAGEYLLVIVEE